VKSDKVFGVPGEKELKDLIYLDCGKEIDPKLLQLWQQ
jgi:hypothetical protein